MSARFTESVVEDAALAWLEAPGSQVKYGRPDRAIASDPGGARPPVTRAYRGRFHLPCSGL